MALVPGAERADSRDAPMVAQTDNREPAMQLTITVIKGKQRRTFKKVASAMKFAGRSKNVTVIVTN